jgi:DNA-binding CsgD family transcriptional regulator
MNLVLIGNTADNVKELNRSRQFREQISGIANDHGEGIILGIATNDSFTPQEKQAALCEWALLDTCFRIQMVRCGQKSWEFPKDPISDQFLDWYMGLHLPGGAIGRYIQLIIAGSVGDFVLEGIANGKIELPFILSDLAEIAIASSPKLQRMMRDLMVSCDSTTEIATFSQDDTIERIANALAKPFVSKANRTINDGENRWNDALEGVWKGSKGILRKWSPMEIFCKAFAGSELQNYLREAIQNQLRQEVRRILRDKDRREAQEYAEIIESDLPPIEDDEGNLISLLDLIPSSPEETTEAIELELLQALNLSETECRIWTMLLEGKTKRQTARELGISRPTLDKYLKAMCKRVRDLPSDELVSPFSHPGSMRILRKEHQWQPIPDPTFYQAMVTIVREELYKKLRY